MDVEENETFEDAPPGGFRSSRGRVATPFISQKETGVASGKVEVAAAPQKTLQFSGLVDVEESPLPEDGVEGNFRPARGRVATPFISQDAMDIASAKAGASPTVMFAKTESVDER